jgi:hypothetical protein
MGATGRLWGVVAIALAAAACGSPDRSDAASDPTRCASCHVADYAAVKNPPHAGVKPTACGVCHVQTGWHPSRTEHPYFELTNAHAKPACFDCHRGDPPVFHGLGKACGGCHQADFDRATFPGHKEFPLTCEECHTTIAWKPSTWKTLPEPTPSPMPKDEPAPPKPKPGKPGKPGKPAPKPVPSAAPTSSAPDVISHPSRRK